MYYVISLHNTMRHEKYITLWRPDNKGYCFSKENAGIYENIEAGYHDGECSKAIKTEDLEDLFESLPYDGEMKQMILNNKKTWEFLNVRMTKNGLVRR